MKKKTFQLALVMGVMGALVLLVWWRYETAEVTPRMNQVIREVNEICPDSINPFKEGKYVIYRQPTLDVLSDSFGVMIYNTNSAKLFGYSNGILQVDIRMFFEMDIRVMTYLIAYHLFMRSETGSEPEKAIAAIEKVNLLLRRNCREYDRLFWEQYNIYDKKGSFNEGLDKRVKQSVLINCQCSTGVKYNNFILTIFRISVMFALIDAHMPQTMKATLVQDMGFSYQP